MNAPSTFQRFIDTLFGPEMQPNVFGYLDDIVNATESFEDHLYWIEAVLKELVGAGLEVNREKCEFCCSQVYYLRFLLGSEGLRPDPEKVAPVVEYPVPKNVKQLRRFLGMLGWYSRFIKGESGLKIPLVRIFRKERESGVGEKSRMRCSSRSALGAVLTQESGDGEHPIVYVSRVLTPAEKNYTTTENSWRWYGQLKS